MTHWLHPDGARELIMFGDYECPQTRDAWPYVERLIERYGDELRLGWRHYPVPRLHPHALRAARRPRPPAPRAASGPTTAGCSRPTTSATSTLLALARDEGLDADRIATELREGAYAETVRADKQTGRELPLKRTPTFLAHGEPWDGFYDIETLSELIA